MEASEAKPLPADWSGSRLVKPVCPVHGIRETPWAVDYEGETVVQYRCPVDDCAHSWTARNLRV